MKTKMDKENMKLDKRMERGQRDEQRELIESGLDKRVEKDRKIGHQGSSFRFNKTGFRPVS
jgi:hypothetical protein